VRRVWLPNVHPAKLWSAILARPISINCTAAALRAVDRAGGVDNYLLRTSDERLASAAGTRLRRLLLDTLKRDARRDARLRPGAAAAAAAEQPAPPQQPSPPQQLR
jgi:ribosomal protein L28